jgi:hypothetical protein
VLRALPSTRRRLLRKSFDRKWRGPSIERLAASPSHSFRAGTDPFGGNTSTMIPSPVGVDARMTEPGAPAAAAAGLRPRGAARRRGSTSRSGALWNPRRALSKMAVIFDVRRGNPRPAGASISNHAPGAGALRVSWAAWQRGFPSHGASLPIVHPLTLWLRPISASDLWVAVFHARPQS